MKASELMKAMADAGAPMEAIIIAVRAIEAEQDQQAETRAKAAERKRRQRERERDESVTVTGQSQDADGTSAESPALSLPPNDNNSNPPTHTHPETTTRARKGTRLSEDWQPKPLTGDTLAVVNAWPEGRVDTELIKFRNHWTSKPGKDAAKLDWQKTWTNWLLSTDERIPKHGKQSNSQRPAEHPELGKTGAAFAAINDRLAARHDPRAAAPGFGEMRNVTPRADDRGNSGGSGPAAGALRTAWHDG